MNNGMDLLSEQTYIITKGFIDAKDERSRTFFGSFLGVVSRKDIKYLSVVFARDDSSRSLSWNELLYVHMEKAKAAENDPLLSRFEDDLKVSLDTNMTLNSIVKNQNAKQAEQAVSRYCLEKLQLKAVCFIDFYDATENDLKLFEGINSLNLAPAAETQPDAATAQPDEGVDPEEAKAPAGAPNDVFVRCEPVLDPVGGVAMNELNVGDNVLCRLPMDSVFYKLLQNNSKGFTGVVTAKVSGLFVNELGTATLSVSLSEGVTGVIKLSGKVRIKLPEDDAAGEGRSERKWNLNSVSPAVVITVAGFIILISAIAILIYVFY
ncbi:MAG: hypothetical protein LBT08_10275 [Synergistaceae bacterium]|nr:hypothetical protein [Synergistaceae bacterium]